MARTVDMLLRGQVGRPEIRELGADGQLQRQLESASAPAAREAVAPRPHGRPRLAAAPLPELEDADAASELPAVEAAAAMLRVYGAGLSLGPLEQVVRARQLPVELVGSVELADAVLSLRQHLGRDPHVRRQAQDLGLPILVLKSAAPPQLQRALERLLQRHREGQAQKDPVAVAACSAQADDALAGLEECRLAVEQVVLPHGQPVELLPRSERVRLMQAELADRYRLRTAVFGRGVEQRLRLFPV